MCAIAGIIDPFISKEQQAISLRAMLSFVGRRGPDSSNIWQKEAVGLAQAQLHIMQSPIDFADPIQPYVLANRAALVWNGSIYNFSELRNELIAKGISIEQGTDTEVLAKGLAQEGIAFLSKLNGIFAIAFWDIQSQKLLLAVDRFGVKPIYYSTQNKQFAFASEIKQFSAIQALQPDFSSLANFLLYNAENNTTSTSFKAINTLRPGHYLSYSFASNQCSVNPWHHFDRIQPKTVLGINDALQDFIKLSADAVGRTQTHQTSQGIGLSGGLDSAWIFYNSTTREEAIKAFTVGVEGSQYDESRVAEQVFSSFARTKDKHFKVAFEPSLLEEELDDLSYIQDEPFTDPSVYMQYRMMKIAAQHGVRVMLSGQGADELLLGYERYSLLESLALPWFAQINYWNHLRATANISLQKFLIFRYVFANAALRNMRLRFVHRGMHAKFLNAADTDFLQKEADAYRSLQALYENELYSANLPKLLRYEDRNAAAFGIEGRQPFLENNLSDFLLQLPLDLKLSNGNSKRILRAALHEVGLNSLASQKEKIGFTAPESIWRPARKEMERLIQESKVLKELYKQLPAYHSNERLCWKLQSIARWEKVYKL